jgi:3,4-dihydroxy-2-butanone 4-phosphate synthase
MYRISFMLTKMSGPSCVALNAAYVPAVELSTVLEGQSSSSSFDEVATSSRNNYYSVSIEDIPQARLEAISKEPKRRRSEETEKPPCLSGHFFC